MGRHLHGILLLLLAGLNPADPSHALSLMAELESAPNILLPTRTATERAGRQQNTNGFQARMAAPSHLALGTVQLDLLWPRFGEKVDEIFH